MTPAYVLAITAVLVLLYYCSYEGFSSKHERANRILQWLSRGRHTYDAYRKRVGGTIVEYEDLLRLVSEVKRPTLDDIKKIL